MTAPTQAPALSPTGILSPHQMAQLGAQLRDAGFNNSRIAETLSMVEEAAYNAAIEAAQKASMAIIPTLLANVQNIRREAALEVATEIQRINGGVNRGMLSNHTNCITAAHGVANSPVRP